MSEKGYSFIQVNEDGEKDFSGIAEGDVVMLPAFGASLQEMKLLNDRWAIMQLSNVQHISHNAPKCWELHLSMVQPLLN